jgi:sigma-54 specific flagellar transcriptional regulator A
VLQERSFERVGSNRTIPCDVRIIAATHRDLEAAIGDGQFREDLFYRLNVFPVQMPPLRDRLEDLPVLIDFLVARQASGSGRAIRFAADALACLARNFWPGNVRELANLLERLAILFPGKLIGAADLPPSYRGQPAASALLGGKWLASEDRAERAVCAVTEAETANLDEQPTERGLPRGGLDLKDHLSAIEVGLIRQALEEADGTVAEAARLLRMRRTTLVEKLRKYRLSA